MIKRRVQVLIPVFALGRAQELCILLDTYWERMNLGNIPIYFAAGLTEKANLYYKVHKSLFFASVEVNTNFCSFSSVGQIKR